MNQAAAVIPDSGVVVISSDKGTGKTYFASQIVEHNKQALRKIMAISPYRSLTGAASEQYAISHYEGHTKREWLGLDALAICLKSIQNFALMQNIPKLNLLILDELSKMLQQLRSRKLYKDKEAKRVYSVLKALIRSADYVLILDADVTETKISWLKSIRKDVTVIENTRYRQLGILTLMATAEALEDMFINTMAEEGRDGQPVIYAANSAAAVQNMEAVLRKINPDYRVLSIHRDNATNKAQRDFLRKPDEHIGNYDAILISPAAETGIDIRLNVYAKFGRMEHSPANTPAADGCAQLFERARNSQKSYMWIRQLEEDGNLEEDADVIFHTKKRAAIKTEELIFDTDDTGNIKLPAEVEEFHRLLSNLEASDNYSRNRLFNTLLALLKRNYNIVTDDACTAINAEAMKEAAQKRKAEWDAAVLTSEPKIDEELEALERAGEVTLEIRAGNLRWHIENFYHQEIDEGLYKFDADGKGRAITRFFADIFETPAAELMDYDAKQIHNHTPLSHREHRTMKAKLAREFLLELYGWDNLEAIAGIVIPKHILVQRASKFIAQNEENLHDFFSYRPEHRRDAWSTTKRVMRLLGIRFQQSRTRDKDAPAEYRIDSEYLNYVQKLAKQYRAGVLEERNKLNPKLNLNWRATPNDIQKALKNNVYREKMRQNAIAYDKWLIAQKRKVLQKSGISSYIIPDFCNATSEAADTPKQLTLMEG